MGEHLKRADFIRRALTDEVRAMLDELEHPPLVERIFPHGWQNATTDKIGELYDLCIRTFDGRAAALTPQQATDSGVDLDPPMKRI